MGPLFFLLLILSISIHDVNKSLTFNNAPDNCSFVDINLSVMVYIIILLLNIT